MQICWLDGIDIDVDTDIWYYLIYIYIYWYYHWNILKHIVNHVECWCFKLAPGLIRRRLGRRAPSPGVPGADRSSAESPLHHSLVAVEGTSLVTALRQTLKKRTGVKQEEMVPANWCAIEWHAKMEILKNKRGVESGCDSTPCFHKAFLNPRHFSSFCAMRLRNALQLCAQ